MPQSLAQIYLHVVFSTKDRKPFLTDRSLRSEMHRYLTGVCRNLDSPTLLVGGVSDHVHLLLRLSRNQNVAELVRDLKRDSSKWIKKRSANLTDFAWQNGYGAFSVSPGHLESLKEYISNQERHHKRETFQEEFKRILDKYHLDYDERYVWD